MSTIAKNAKTRRGKTGGIGAGEKAGSGVVAVFVFFLVIVFVLFLFLDCLELHGIDCDHFEICPTLGAGEDFAFIHLIFFDIQAGLALRTMNHNCLHHIIAPVIFSFFWDAGQVGPALVVRLPMLRMTAGAARIRRKIVVISDGKIRSRSDYPQEYSKTGSQGFSIAVLLLASIVPLARAQQAPTSADPRIKAALNEISAGQIQSNIEKLVSFQTRATTSAQDPASISAGRGIGAAREWIKSEFERYSRDCAGCLEVKIDSFTQPVSE